MAEQLFQRPVFRHRARSKRLLVESRRKPPEIVGLVAEAGHQPRVQVAIAAGLSLIRHEMIIGEANMQCVSGRLAVVAAGIIGYVAGTWNVGTASAAKIRRETAQELLDVDRQFDADTTRNGVEGWVTHFAPDGIMMPAASEMVVGQPAVREFISKVFSTPGFAMRWEPVEGGVSGELGYTYGVSKTTRRGADGKPQVAYGKYVTIWRKQRDGTWQIAVDIGNSSPPPAEKRKK